MSSNSPRYLWNPKEFPSILMETRINYGGRDFLYFPDGIEVHRLFIFGSAKMFGEDAIRRFGSCLLYLNPGLDYEYFCLMMEELVIEKRSKIFRSDYRMSSQYLRGICWDIHQRRPKPVANTVKKFFFNPKHKWDQREIRNIISRLTGQSYNLEYSNVVEVVDSLRSLDSALTLVSISDALGVSYSVLSNAMDINPAIKVYIELNISQSVVDARESRKQYVYNNVISNHWDSKRRVMTFKSFLKSHLDLGVSDEQYLSLYRKGIDSLLSKSNFVNYHKNMKGVSPDEVISRYKGLARLSDIEEVRLSVSKRRDSKSKTK